MSKLFSERYGYTKPSDVIVKGRITQEIINAISSCFTQLKEDLDDADYMASETNGDDDWQITSKKSFYKMDRTVWTDFMDRRADKYLGGIRMCEGDAVQQCLLDGKIEWYKKLDCVEFAIEYMLNHYTDSDRKAVLDGFVCEINRQFERLRFGYRIVQGKIVDIVSDVEVQSINKAIEPQDIVSSHLSQALNLYAIRPNPDYRNSIKESITAVETLFRKMTNEKTFGKAYEKLKQQMPIHPRLEEMIQKLYDYTNQKDTGIRHAKVETDNTFLPGAQEALLMLVTCSAIINYVKGRKINDCK